jgi:hypothetical protein
MSVRWPLLFISAAWAMYFFVLSRVVSRNKPTVQVDVLVQLNIQVRVIHDN